MKPSAELWSILLELVEAELAWARLQTSLEGTTHQELSQYLSVKGEAYGKANDRCYDAVCRLREHIASWGQP